MSRFISTRDQDACNLLRTPSSLSFTLFSQIYARAAKESSSSLLHTKEGNPTDSPGQDEPNGAWQAATSFPTHLVAISILHCTIDKSTLKIGALSWTEERDQELQPSVAILIGKWARKAGSRGKE